MIIVNNIIKKPNQNRYVITTLNPAEGLKKDAKTSKGRKVYFQLYSNF